MRQSLAKGTRRDLRRAIGPAALETMREIEQAIGIMQSGLAGAQREIATLAVNHADFKRSASQRIDGSLPTYEFLDRSFLKRLRWLFTGA